MLTNELQHKVDRAIKLLKRIPKDEPVQVAYSGGKDSDVILQLAKEAECNYRAIYNSTTIDPPGTIQHCKEMGAEIIRPKKTFFQLVETMGLPNRFFRFCCAELKEKKMLNRAIIGVRRDESVRRAARYKEPTECRYFGAKKEENRVEQIYPILDWTTEDVAIFLQDRGIKCAPIYYDELGNFHPERRLGCMCCPLMSQKKRIAEFKKYPKMLRLYCRAHAKYLADYPDAKTHEYFNNTYEAMLWNLNFRTVEEFKIAKNGLFGTFDAKQILEDYFKIKLD